MDLLPLPLHEEVNFDAAKRAKFIKKSQTLKSPSQILFIFCLGLDPIEIRKIPKGKGREMFLADLAGG